MPDSPTDSDKNVDTPVDTEIKAAATEQVATEATDGKAAESSPAEKPAGTMLDAVKAAIAPKEASPPSETPGKTVDADPASTKTEGEADDSEELSEDELKGLHAKTKKRFQKLTTKLEASDAQISALRPKAESYDKIDAYIRNAGLSNQEASGALELAALLRHDPKGARQRLLPIMAELDRIVGEVIPSELQQRVQAGWLTEQDAKALARAHADAQINERKLREITERNEADAQVRELRTQTDTTVNVVEKWETEKAKKDPDWHLKRAEVADQVELAIDRESRKLGRPWFPNPQEAVKLSEDALTRINERTKRFSPKPAAISSVTGSASTRSTAAPTTMLDVVRQAVGA